MLGAGGVMAREAAALGTPAYTVSQRAAGGRRRGAPRRRAVCRRAAAADDVALQEEGRARGARVAPRDPQLFVDAAPRAGARTAPGGRASAASLRDAGGSGSPPLV